MKNWNVRNKNLAGLKKFAENKGLLVIVLAADTHVSGDDLDDHDVDWSSKTSNVEFSVVSVTDANGVTISGKQFHKLIEEIKNEKEIEIEELQCFYEAHGWSSQEAWSQAEIDCQ